jgi:hypothetical protein
LFPGLSYGRREKFLPTVMGFAYDLKAIWEMSAEIHDVFLPANSWRGGLLAAALSG